MLEAEERAGEAVEDPRASEEKELQDKVNNEVCVAGGAVTVNACTIFVFVASFPKKVQDVCRASRPMNRSRADKAPLSTLSDPPLDTGCHALSVF